MESCTIYNLLVIYLIIDIRNGVAVSMGRFHNRPVQPGVRLPVSEFHFEFWIFFFRFFKP